MIRTLLKGFTALLIVIVIIIAWALTINKPQQHNFKHYSLPKDIRTLQQNWTADIRQQMSHTSFGSQILPLSWLLNLEHPYNPSMLIDARNMEALALWALRAKSLWEFYINFNRSRQGISSSQSNSSYR